MREHKYQAWYNGHMCPVYQLLFDETCQHLFAVDIVIDVAKRIVQHVVDLDTVQLREFTGQQDKNDKDIYESDLCRIDGKIYEVYWNEDRWGLQDAYPKPGSRLKFNYDNGSDYAPYEINWDTCEVIGNIYESEKQAS
jgi:uncharacterized phage protein (TIGR01671 family)